MIIPQRHKLVGFVSAILLFAAFSCIAQEDIYQKTLKVSGGYRSNLVGGEIYTRAHFPSGSFVWSPSLWTYQSADGWSSWDLSLRSVFHFCPTCTDVAPPTHWRIVGRFGMIADYLDLSGRNPSSSFTTSGLISRYRPDFEIGVGIDSVGIFCRECTWTFTSELTAANFIPFAYSFQPEDTPGETLSAAIKVVMRLDTPGGTIGGYSYTTARDYQGEDIFRVYYASPWLIGDNLQFRFGWETGYLGFARLDFNLRSFLDSNDLALQFGVFLPEKTSYWQWQIGLVFESIREIPGRPGFKSGGNMWR